MPSLRFLALLGLAGFALLAGCPPSSASPLDAVLLDGAVLDAHPAPVPDHRVALCGVATSPSSAAVEVRAECAGVDCTLTVVLLGGRVAPLLECGA